MSTRTAAEATKHPPTTRKRDRDAVQTVNRVLWTAVPPLPEDPGRAYPHAMAVPRHLAALCAAVLVVLALGASVAAAAAPPATLSVTERIFADYALDHTIDGHYSARDLDTAL